MSNSLDVAIVAETNSEQFVENETASLTLELLILEQNEKERKLHKNQ